MQEYLWTRGNTLCLKDEHLTIECRIKCHLHTCPKMQHLMLLSLQLHLAPTVWGLKALWRFPSALFNLLYVDNSHTLCTVNTKEITFYFPFQKVPNDNCPKLFDPVWLAPWCLLLLPLFFQLVMKLSAKRSSSWTRGRTSGTWWPPMCSCTTATTFALLLGLTHGILSLLLQI